MNLKKVPEMLLSIERYMTSELNWVELNFVDDAVRSNSLHCARCIVASIIYQIQMGEL